MGFVALAWTPASAAAHVHITSHLTRYGKDEITFKANSRPAELKVTLNGEHHFTAKLKDRNRIQKIHIPATYRKPVETIRLEIKKVYEGWQFEDTCISHVQLLAKLEK